ncbi:MAG: hypothetical protein KGN16_25355 [Burkholderiales bacterium]|nr:hypothetical protein [Burkholderiales bacterium]
MIKEGVVILIDTNVSACEEVPPPQQDIPTAMQRVPMFPRTHCNFSLPFFTIEMIYSWIRRWSVRRRRFGVMRKRFG